MPTAGGVVPPNSLLVRTDPELWLFLPPHRRRARFEVRHDADASLAHVVQALGIPLTEVGMLGLDGVAVPATCIPGAGAVVEISPVVRPQSMDDASGFL